MGGVKAVEKRERGGRRGRGREVGQVNLVELCSERGGWFVGLPFAKKGEGL